MAAKYTKQDLLEMTERDHAEILFRGTPLDLSQITDSNYMGVDFGLPPWMNKILWKKFRKTMYRDPVAGVIRGWNVRLEQNGLDGPSIPMRNRKGEPWAFGHYLVQSAEGLRFPKNLKVGACLEFRSAGNNWFDPAQFALCPMVAVNEGSVDLILGWEIFKFGDVFVPLRDYWMLEREGPLDFIAPTPRPDRLRAGGGRR